jgi:hypothetical protein
MGYQTMDIQLLTLNYVDLRLFQYHIYTVRNIHRYSTADFKIRLSYEPWDGIFGNNDIMDEDTLFNTSLNIHIRIFYIFFCLL